MVARRAAIVLCSAQGMSVSAITGTVFADAGHIRSVLKDFNVRGFAALRPGRSPGRPRRIDEQTRERIVAVALSRPHDLGLPFTHWSLPKLRDHLIETGVVESISHEGVRQVLSERGISFQRAKTWKQSSDPDFERKKGLFFASYRRRPRRSRRLCVDEFGPLQVKPQPGVCWAPQTPARAAARDRSAHAGDRLPVRLLRPRRRSAARRLPAQPLRR